MYSVSPCCNRVQGSAGSAWNRNLNGGKVGGCRLNKKHDVLHNRSKASPELLTKRPDIEEPGVFDLKCYPMPLARCVFYWILIIASLVSGTVYCKQAGHMLMKQIVPPLWFMQQWRSEGRLICPDPYERLQTSCCMYVGGMWKSGGVQRWIKSTGREVSR